MKYRTLPHTNEQIGELGLGLAKIHLAEKKEQIQILENAMENGVNYFDLCGHTLDVYRAFAEAAGSHRKQLFTQMHFGAVYDEQDVYGRKRCLNLVKSSFERVLEASATDYTDFGMLHCIDEEEEFEQIMADGTMDYVLDLQKQGIVHHIGLSTHTPSIALKFINTGKIDMIMFSINPAYDYTLGAWSGGSYNERMDLYNTAEQQGIGLSVMKVFAGGQLLDPALSPLNVTLNHYQCMRYALDRPAVTTILPGVTSMEELNHLLGYYDAEEEESRYDILKDAAPSEAKGRCVYCSHCAPCPKGLDIALINKYYDLSCTGDELAANHYHKLAVKADACTECGRCNRRCPFGVDQKERLKEIDAYFKKDFKNRKMKH